MDPASGEYSVRHDVGRSCAFADARGRLGPADSVRIVKQETKTGGFPIHTEPPRQPGIGTGADDPRALDDWARAWNLSNIMLMVELNTLEIGRDLAHLPFGTAQKGKISGGQAYNALW